MLAQTIGGATKVDLVTPSCDMAPAIVRSALLRENIIQAGVPDVTAAWAHECGNARLLLGVSIKQCYPGHVAQAGHIAAMCHVGAYCGREFRPENLHRDLAIVPEILRQVDGSHPWSTPLDPRLDPKQREQGDYTNSRAIIDACRPWHWREEFPRVNMPSPKLAKLAQEKFGYLLR